MKYIENKKFHDLYEIMTSRRPSALGVNFTQPLAFT